MAVLKSTKPWLNAAVGRLCPVAPLHFMTNVNNKQNKTAKQNRIQLAAERSMCELNLLMAIG